MPSRAKKGTLVATEVICIVVGARPIEYEQREVLDRRTGEKKTIPMTDPAWEPKDPGDEGVPYTFRVGQKVHPGHPAYESAKLKSVFVPLEEAEEMNLTAV